VPIGWRIVHILYLFIFVLCSLGLAFYEVHDYQHSIRIRDVGINDFGIVTRKYEEYGLRYNTYFIDYSYVPMSKGVKVSRPISSRHHEVLAENYYKYQVLRKIPIRYDPDNIFDTHLNVQGYWSNVRLAVSGFLLFSVGVGICLALVLMLGILLRSAFTRSYADL
jgi:hypothetical protein